MLFLEYPACITCRKAKKWLEENNLLFEDRHIKQNPPTKEELSSWQKKSGLSLRRFFNTSGQLYKSLNLKERLDDMSEEEQLSLLASDGMLVQRPLLIGEDFVFVGFKSAEWSALL